MTLTDTRDHSLMEWKAINMDSPTSLQWGLETKMSEVDDGKTGVAVAVVAVTGNVDSGGDVILPGAFKGVSAPPWVVLGHQFTEEKLIGKTLEWEELLPGDVRLPQGLKDAGFGAMVAKAEFNLEKQIARETWADLKFHPNHGWSIGYFTIDFDMAKTDTERAAGIKRYLKLVDVLEYSPVIVGMNRLAHTVSVKGAAMSGQDTSAIIAGKVAELEGAEASEGEAKTEENEPESKVAVALSGSFEERQGKLRVAAEAWADEKWPADEDGRPTVWHWMVGSWPDHIVVRVEIRSSGDLEYWSIAYTLGDDGDVALGEASEVEVTASVTPKAAPKTDPAPKADPGPEAKADGPEDEPEAKSSDLGAAIAEWMSMSPSS